MLARVKTLGMLAGLATYAEAHGSTECHHDEMDVGGGKNPCGYMAVVALFGEEGMARPEWFGAEGFFKTVPMAELDAAEKCQALCEAYGEECQFWAWSKPHESDGEWKVDCTLKSIHPTYDACNGEWNGPDLYEHHDHMVSGPRTCDECYKVNTDVGGEKNACGYMAKVIVYGIEGGAAAPEWFTSKDGRTVNSIPEGEMTADNCQRACAANPECDYWHMSKDHCYLKADYSEAQKMVHGGKCEPIYEGDYKVGEGRISGPKKCNEMYLTVACGEVKKDYKAAKCCGAPMNRLGYYVHE